MAEMRARASMSRALAAFNASLPRDGRIIRQCRYCFYAEDRPVSMSELREYCYYGKPRRHWMYRNIRRALRRLGAVQVGRSPSGRGRPGIWTLPMQHACNMQNKCE